MDRDAGGGARARGRLVTLVSTVCILGWVIPALLMLGKGFAVQDEGTYVLSYRFWSSNPYLVAGSQYFYGPIFEALGESIADLRLIRVVMVLAANAWFAWSFVGWLEHHRSGPPLSSRTSLVLLLTAAGWTSYLWVPLTPGYYDLTADACLALVALMLLALRRSPSAGLVNPLATGVVSVVLLVTKWPAASVVALTVGVVVWHLARASTSVALRYVGLVAAGALAALLLVQLFLVSLGDYVSIVHTLSSITASSSHSAGALLHAYVRDAGTFALGAAIIAVPLLVSYALARRASAHGHPLGALAWLLGAMVLVAGWLPFGLGWHGGSTLGTGLVLIALSGLVSALVIGVAAGGWKRLPGRGSGWAVAAVLLLVPVLQAAGTNLQLTYVSLECAAMWMALLLLPVAHLERSHLAVTAVLGNLAVFAVVGSMLAGSTTLMSPFKAGSFHSDTADVSGLGVTVSPELAGQYAALQTALDPYVVRGVTPILTLDQKAGLTYVLGGVPAGSTWTDKTTPGATADVLALACRNGDVASAPVLIVDRDVDPDLRAALTSCGYSFPSGYRRLPVPDGPPDITTYVPR